MAIKATLSTIAPLTIQQAAAEIVQLINMRPTSPRQDEIEAIVARASGPALPATLSEVQTQLREAIQEYVATEKVLDEANRARLDEKDPQQHRAIQVRFEVALDRVGELADQLPAPARSITDVVLLAGVVYCHDDKNDDGSLRNLDHDCPDERARARLVEAVLEYAGINYR
jgi:hypothetical protein